jgi:hypothetical protein
VLLDRLARRYGTHPGAIVSGWSAFDLALALRCLDAGEGLDRTMTETIAKAGAFPVVVINGG